MIEEHDAAVVGVFSANILAVFRTRAANGWPELQLFQDPNQPFQLLLISRGEPFPDFRRLCA
ncbi:hypothetical protein JHW45_01000 [Paracoccus stylophorae]|uniref:Uncharacterized protein n=1 Tax=Paracoccus stylophorae TaxID=659350 RepID=A0ABY7SVH1_9RHOB|nr:hypothetical protein [Paracoccus stylophorae]WCR11026.1 hypothetical protein JHW45_01000 [Paracoccus stylophorae]